MSQHMHTIDYEKDFLAHLQYFKITLNCEMRRIMELFKTQYNLNYEEKFKRDNLRSNMLK